MAQLGSDATLSGDHDAAGTAGSVNAFTFGGVAQAAALGGDRRGSGGVYASLEGDGDDAHSTGHTHGGGKGPRLGDTGDVEVGSLGHGRRNGHGATAK